MTPMRPVPIVAACLGLVPFLAGCVVHVDSGGFTARKEQRFEVTGRPTVDLDTFDGAIEVQAWNKSEVLVVVETRASSKALLEGIDIETEHEGSRVALKVTAPDKGGWSFETGGVSRSAKVIATVPIDSEVRLRSGDGSVRVERVRGVIDARTSDGRIVMRDVSGDIVADSGDGSVQMEDVDGRCTVSTRDGSVLVSGRLRGGLKATTGDGSVTIRAAEGSEVSDDWQIETTDGGVVLALPDQLDARLDARTNDGRITLNGFPDLVISREGDGRVLQAVLGKGERVLRIRTGDGSITLKRVHVPMPPAPPAPPAPPGTEP
jgi:hypothetical protein